MTHKIPYNEQAFVSRFNLFSLVPALYRIFRSDSCKVQNLILSKVRVTAPHLWRWLPRMCDCTVVNVDFYGTVKFPPVSVTVRDYDFTTVNPLYIGLICLRTVWLHYMYFYISSNKTFLCKELYCFVVNHILLLVWWMFALCVFAYYKNLNEYWLR